MTARATLLRLQGHTAKVFQDRVLVATKAQDAQIAYFDALAAAAQQAADSLLCSSILAGHSSESDEFADIGIFLGEGADYSKGNEKQVLKSLGLEPGKVRAFRRVFCACVPC